MHCIDKLHQWHAFIEIEIEVEIEIEMFIELTWELRSYAFENWNLIGTAPGDGRMAFQADLPII